MEFPSVNAAMDGVIKMYEMRLKQLNPNRDNITYDIQQLYDYIDSLEDLSALTYVRPRAFLIGRFDASSSMYAPAGRDWVKKKVFQVLKNQAGN